jgi:hypothetical protein
MDTTVLLEKLVDIERYVGVAPDAEIRRKVIDIEEYILETQTETAEGMCPEMYAMPGRGLRAVNGGRRNGSDVDFAAEKATCQPVPRSLTGQKNTVVFFASPIPCMSDGGPIPIDQGQTMRRRVVSIQR